MLLLQLFHKKIYNYAEIFGIQIPLEVILRKYSYSFSKLQIF